MYKKSTTCIAYSINTIREKQKLSIWILMCFILLLLFFSFFFLLFCFIFTSSFNLSVYYTSCVMILSTKINTQTMTDIWKIKSEWFSFYWNWNVLNCLRNTNWYWQLGSICTVQNKRFKRWNENKPWCVVYCDIQ